MDKINFEDGTKVSGAKVTIDGVDYTVTPARYTGATPLSAYVMNKLQDNIEDTIDQNVNNIGGKDYDATSTYDVGDIVRYNEKIYKCITAITTAENFDISKWEQTNIVEIVQSEKSKIYELIEALSTPIVGEGENITLNDTAEKRFENFDIEGNSVQDGTPSPDNEVPILSAGDNGSITEKITNFRNWNTSTLESGGLTNGLPNTNYTTCRTKDFIDIKPNTNFAFSINGTLNRVVVSMYDKDKNFIATDGTNGYNAANGLFTTYANAYYIKYRAYNDDKQLFLDGNIQLEEGSTATPYVPHEEQDYSIPVQQPMRAIRNVRDKFILKENGKWYERHYILRTIFDGTEGWSTSVNSQFELLGTNYKKYRNGGVCICSHFPYGLNTDNHIWIGNDIFIFIKDIIYTTLEEFKTWLTTQYNAGTPVYVDYILETPLDIECTSEQTEILNQIYIKAKSYKGVTYIYSNDEVSPNCYVEAVKDLTTLIQ